jgi:hypothetical protein
VAAHHQHFETARTTLTNIAQSIVSAIFGVFNRGLGSIGRNIVDSIGNALRAGLQWVADQARRIAEAALQAALDALGIGSAVERVHVPGRDERGGVCGRVRRRAAGGAGGGAGD